MDYSKAFVCLMGMGTVFFGLICLVALTYLMGWFCRRLRPAAAPAASAAPAAPAPSVGTENREELAAAISAALAEELGTDITGIRILSLRKL